MSSVLGQSDEPIYFPLNQGERASHLKVNQLLPRAVYERLAEMLHESVRSLGRSTPDDGSERFMRNRGHSSIFLDGDRGTGKTTVIVNLPMYLAADGARERFPGLAQAVHILKPIDPSQLEDGDDLFLNVVVAAVLGDKEVIAQRDREPRLWEALHQSLQTLGIALAGRETQGDGIGLDRLRAFMGTQELAGAVHDFFEKAVKLLGKRVLVLPIDDVDTTLHRAFENLEVVRRYLSTPVLVPIVCGDLSLYREVTWRDAFRRLTKDMAHYNDRAKPVADSLAHEYLRKILPLHRRLRMPEVDAFLTNYRVLLGAENIYFKGRARLALPDLDAWLRALLAGPVNDHENSRLHIPIPTVRALSQLLSRVRPGISALTEAYFNRTAPLPETDLMRRISLRRRGKAPAPRRRDAPPLPPRATAPSHLSLAQWQSALLEHFMYEPSAGAVCLVLLAAQHWREGQAGSVLDTPLFQPLQQLGRPELRYIETRAKLAWQGDLVGRLPESWVNTRTDEAILPFATPEIGRAVVPDNWEVDEEFENDLFFGARAGVFIELLTHHNFYSSSKRATLICSGRLLELIVTSLVREISSDDIDRILTTAPFHSAVSVAATKAVHFSIDEIESSDLDSEDEEIESADSGGHDEEIETADVEIGDEDLKMSLSIKELARLDRGAVIDEIVSDINDWRREAYAVRLSRSPWLVYCALNKTFNQAPLFTRPLAVGQQPSGEALSDVFASGLAAFNSFWAALASFEKGPLFDLRSEISNVNLLKRRGDFTRTDLYTLNVKPLIERVVEHGTIQGEEVISATWALQEHPLRVRLQGLFEFAREREGLAQQESEVIDGRAFLLQALGLPMGLRRVTIASITKALVDNAPNGLSPRRFGQSVLRNVERRYPDLAQLDTLREALDRLRQKPSDGAL